jgi:hypothetical protein
VPEPTASPAAPPTAWRRRLLPAVDLLVLITAYLSQTPRVLSLGGPDATYLALLSAIAPTFGITTLRWTHDGRPLAGQAFPRLACASSAASRVTFVFVIGSWIEESWRAGKLVHVGQLAGLLATPLPAELWARYLSPRVLVWLFATSVLAGVLRKLEVHRTAAGRDPLRCSCGRVHDRKQALARRLLARVAEERGAPPCRDRPDHPACIDADVVHGYAQLKPERVDAADLLHLSALWAGGGPEALHRIDDALLQRRLVALSADTTRRDDRVEGLSVAPVGLHGLERNGSVLAA